MSCCSGGRNARYIGNRALCTVDQVKHFAAKVLLVFQSVNSVVKGSKILVGFCDGLHEELTNINS